jgi:uncharacterized protein (TIGR02266 family)
MGEAARKLESVASQRGAPRAQVIVSIDMFSEHNFWSGLTMNMSEGGVFVATHHAVPQGTVLALELTLPGSETPITAVAEVRWTRDYNGESDVPPGLGLQFIGLDEISLARIRAFVATIRDPLYYED